MIDAVADERDRTATEAGSVLGEAATEAKVDPSGSPRRFDAPRRKRKRKN